MKKEVKINSENPLIHHKRTTSQKAADYLTSIMGSWIFILGFLTLLIVWMCINTFYLINYHNQKPFDPYPFILLNLVLSCLAAIQAPIILMSQNREAQKDRIRAEYDYAVNRKSERKIEKIIQQLNSIEEKI